jgi:hypothetical protein
MLKKIKEFLEVGLLMMCVIGGIVLLSISVNVLAEINHIRINTIPDIHNCVIYKFQDKDYDSQNGTVVQKWTVTCPVKKCE